ncbi:MAG: zinc ABC transporter substrate-binding protein [Ruminococcaceae bacterium]|nr:zinc ABC transporter substrate-binding protein [Oscillospiraceae bacterium]
MKKLICLLLCLCLLTACTPMQKESSENSKLKIVATLFPQFDFAREIAGDKANISLLLPPGAESHSYEPSPADIMTIAEADLFIYTGDAMEAWVSPVLDALEDGPYILDITQDIDLSAGGHETVHETAQDEARHSHDVDPHVFTNPRFARKMATTLCAALTQLDPENAAIYEANAAKLDASLAALDQSFKAVTENAARNKVIFGGRFPFAYFVEAYGLSYDAAYDSCSSESEPAAGDVARLIDTVRAENIPVVFYEELANPKTALLICEETGAKPLLLHSCHNISKEDFENGVSYLSLMQTNVEHLKEALG